MAQLMLVNPRKRRSRRKSPTKRRRSSSLARVTTRSVRTYRRNPARRKGMFGDVGKSLQKGAIGAGGALLVDVVMSRIPALSSIGGEQMKPVVRAAVGVATGMVVGNVMKNKQLGTALTEGALTVGLYNTGKEMLGPTIGLDGYGGDLLGYGGDLLGENGDLLGDYYSAAQTSDRPEGMDGYYEGSDSEMGYYDA